VTDVARHTSSEPIVLRTRAGHALDVPAHHWLHHVGNEEIRVLERAVGPVLDVGCGPGRHVRWLRDAGVAALGIDVSPHAVRLARARGARARTRCVFSHIPITGRWQTVLLLDGNIGIGADPVALLTRCSVLLHPAGRVLAELAPPGTATERTAARLELHGARGPWFEFSTVGADRLAEIADAACLTVDALWRDGARWFAELTQRRVP
jgi:SAM-dependent methyltransferase